MSAARARRGAHALRARGDRPASCVVITVSDTRGRARDVSGADAEALLRSAGHEVARREWVRDEIPAIRRAVRRALSLRATDLVVLTGGTGIAKRDVTPEAVEPLLERELPGFGELFRARSFAQVGAAAWLSRAGAGVARGRLVAYLPGSPAAIALGLGEILVPELAHALRLLGRMNTGD